MLRHPHGSGRRRVIGVVVMVGGHGEFDAFTRDGQHAFLHRRIAMTAVRQCMDVTVRSDPASGVHFPLETQGDFPSLPGL